MWLAQKYELRKRRQGVRKDDKKVILVYCVLVRVGKEAKVILLKRQESQQTSTWQHLLKWDGDILIFLFMLRTTSC